MKYFSSIPILVGIHIFALYQHHVYVLIHLALAILIACHPISKFLCDHILILTGHI